MSIEATNATWKLSSGLVTSTEKLLLLSCADRAGENGICWPSIKRLCKDTGLERKTVISSRQSLIEKSLLEYTGEMKGRSGRIPVMRLTYVDYRHRDDDELTENDKFSDGSKNGTIKNCAKLDSPENGTISKNLQKQPHSNGSENGTIEQSQKRDTEPKRLEPKRLNIKKEKYKKEKKDFISEVPSETKPKTQTKKSPLPQFIEDDNVFAIPEQMILDWLVNRKLKKAAVTQTVWNKITKELTKCKEHGIDPIDAFETMVASGWQSMQCEWLINKQHANKQEIARKKEASQKLADERFALQELEALRRAERERLNNLRKIEDAEIFKNIQRIIPQGLKNLTQSVGLRR